MEKKKIITIDGPSGAGKSTVSKMLATKLGYIYLDTGALYRALAYKTLKIKISPEDEYALSGMCSTTNVILKNIKGEMKVYVDGEDVGGKIRSEEVGLTASKISTFAVVRERLINLQREAGKNGGIVAEGRDMGSVVFSCADYKFYLDANIEERTNRRYKELSAKGVIIGHQVIQKHMIDRDNQDSKRAIAPLRIPADALIIDSTGLSAEQVVGKIMELISVKNGENRPNH